MICIQHSLFAPGKQCPEAIETWFHCKQKLSNYRCLYSQEICMSQESYKQGDSSLNTQIVDNYTIGWKVKVNDME